MSLHESDLKSRLTRFLNRKRMPRHLDGKDAAQADEIAALVAVLARNAPRGSDQLAEWWPHFEGSLGEMCGANWPTEREVVDAARRCREGLPKLVVQRDETDMSDAAIFGRLMARGEAVPVGALYGIVACEMIARGLVDHATMRAYRSGWFLRRRAAYDDEHARREEAEQVAKHEAAKEIWRQRNDAKQRRDVQLPDKSAGFTEGFAA